MLRVGGFGRVGWGGWGFVGNLFFNYYFKLLCKEIV